MLGTVRRLRLGRLLLKQNHELRRHGDILAPRLERLKRWVMSLRGYGPGWIVRGPLPAFFS